MYVRPALLPKSRLNYAYLHQGLLKRYFIESWIYTASLEVVDKCHQLVNARKMNAAAIPDLLPILAELTELATRQVEKLGMIFGYLPRAHPFLMSAQSLTLDDPEDRQIDEAEEAMDTPSHLESSNAELQDSFRDEAKFDSLYRSMLDRVHEAWTSSMRMRSANKVKGTLAALEQYVFVNIDRLGETTNLLHNPFRARSNQKRALNIYADLVDDFSRTRWTAVEAQLLRQTVSLREGVKDAQGQTERLLSILALLRNGLSTGSLSWTLASKRIDGAEAASSWLEEARQLSQQLDKGAMVFHLCEYQRTDPYDPDFAVIDVPAFTVKLASSIGQFLDNEDGICVKLAIENHLPCVCLTLISSHQACEISLK